MERRTKATALRRDFEDVITRGGRSGLRLASPSNPLRGPDKYRILDLKRRRAQIRARRELGLA